ncbi:putative ferulic acid Esterase/Feruloyl esterase [Xylariales sp. PMI_506]|nr:putative ferulic acid Esterase/Feruloyl esterase [Xylariales sp. PMI_506]
MIARVAYAALWAAATAHATSLSGDCNISTIQTYLPSNATVLNVTQVAAGGSFGQSAEVDPPYPTIPINLPSLCAVIVNATSSNESSFTFGLFLPDDWNNRFLAVGNGGFAGGINWLAMADGLPYGFATVSTDTGHTGDFLDMSFALNSVERKADWGYRAMHESIVMAKAIVAGYYGDSPKYSYYTGCSTGGRQGMKEVQMFPDDFDGVMAGCPSWWTTHQQTWQLEIGLINLPENTSHYIPQTMFDWISDEVLKQCDEADGSGIADGIIMDPKRCDFYAEALLCAPNVTSTDAAPCLTAPQIQTLSDLHRPLAYGNNTWVYPNFGLGSEAQMPSSFGDVGTNAPSLYGTQYVQYMVVNDPDWDFNDFDYAIIQEADAVNPGLASAIDFDLSAFYGRGGKLLQYHGYADGLIPTDASVYLYNQIRANMTAQGVDLDDWYRFFLVPGMQHCGGSVYDAPWYFGGSGQAGTLADVPAAAQGDLANNTGLNDARHDAFLALIQWVEEGVAPDSLVATKFVNDTSSLGIQQQRPICPYPKFAQYVGAGNVTDADSWSCVNRLGM